MATSLNEKIAAITVIIIQNEFVIIRITLYFLKRKESVSNLQKHIISSVVMP